MVTLSHSERLIPPKFTLPIDLSTKQHSIDANAITEPVDRINKTDQRHIDAHDARGAETLDHAHQGEDRQ